MKTTQPIRPATIAALLVLGMLAACARNTGPAPVELRGLTGAAPAPRATAGSPRVAAAPLTAVSVGTLPRGGADGHLVGRGETLYGVARQYDVPVRALIDANDLQPPYQLIVGQRLSIPQQRTHTVIAGDTLYSISRRYGVDMSEVVRLNTISPPYAVKLGEKLLLPAPVMVAAAGPVPMPPVMAEQSYAPPAGFAGNSSTAPIAAIPPPASNGPAAPLTGVAVAVTPLAPPSPAASISTPSIPSPPAIAAVPSAPLVLSGPPQSAAADLRQPARPATNARSDASTLAESAETAAIPAPGATVVASAAIPAVPAIAPPAAPTAPLAAPAIVGEPATPLPEVPADSAPRRPANVTEPPPPPPRAAKTFLWPLRGRVLATYGERGGGQHNDGINIAATRGTAVHAAENGVVAYAGNEIRGFGNLLLIRHADGFMTAYAHNDELLVQRGDVVRRGQVISRVGSTGNVSQPQLHFEVRKGTQAIDPETVLGNPAQASAF